MQKAADGGVASAERSKAGGSSSSRAMAMDDDPNDCVELASRTMRSVGQVKRVHYAGDGCGRRVPCR